MVICKYLKRENRLRMFRRPFSITRINLLRWRNDRRIWIIFLFIGLLLVRELRGYTAYGLDSGEKCTGFLLPVLFVSGGAALRIMKTMLYLGCLLILCDAPFMYPSTPYMVIRSQRNCWWMGECMYILSATFFYALFIVIVSTAVVLPVATFGDSWGGVLKDFVYGNGELYAGDLNQLYNMNLVGPSAAMARLYPVGAQMYSFFMVWASFFLLGLIQYLVSLTSKSMFLGFVTAGVFVFLDPIMYRMSASLEYRWLNYFSLITWVDVNNLYMHGGKKTVVTIPYIISVYAILILLLLLVIWRVSKKIVIEVRKEV